MNVLEASNLYLPTKAVIIHKRTAKDTDIPPFYLETHDITRKEGKFLMGAGEPTSRDQLMDLATAIRTREGVKLRFRSVMPAEILYVRSNDRKAAIMWYVKPQRRKILTKAELKVKQGVANVPGMVFLVMNDKLYVYAVKGRKRPTERTQLMNAPFWNIYTDGGVCLGSAKVKMKYTTYYEQIITAYEHMFWNSFFSSFGTEGQCKGSLPKLWNTIMNTKRKFPESALVVNKTHKTLGQLISKFK